MLIKVKPKSTNSIKCLPLYKGSNLNLSGFAKPVLYKPQEYVLKCNICEVNAEKEQYQNENTSQKYLSISSSHHSEFIESCIGRLESIFYKKLRKPSQKFPNSSEELIITGTAFFIGKNLLLTVGHNIFMREFNQLASQVYFYPETLNKPGNTPTFIKAKTYKVYHDYSNPNCEYHNKYDIGLVVLEQNDFSTDENFLEIEWSYKRWQDEDKNLTIYGYPIKLKQKNKWKLDYNTNTTNSQTSESIFYFHQTSEGYSGGPLIRIKQHNAGHKISTIGVHKGLSGTGRYGITFNTLPSIQEVIYQLCEQLKVETILNSYQYSERRLRLQLKTQQMLGNAGTLKSKGMQLKLNQSNCSSCTQILKENCLLKQKVNNNSLLINKLIQKQLEECSEMLQKNGNQMSNQQFEKKNMFSPFGKGQDLQGYKQNLLKNKNIIMKNDNISKVYYSQKVIPKLPIEQVDKSNGWKNIMNKLDELTKNITRIDSSNKTKNDVYGYQGREIITLAWKQQRATNPFENPSLTQKINDDRFKAFIEIAGKFKNLSSINLSYNQITDDGFKAFVQQSDKFNNLYSINFSNNQISNNGFKAFIKKAANFKSLGQIYFYKNKISYDLIQGFDLSFNQQHNRLTIWY